MSRVKPRSPGSDGDPARWETIADGMRVRRMVEGNGSAILLYRLEAGRRFEDHEHPFAELGVVLTGEGTLLIGGESRPLQVGDSFYIPGGVRHGFEVPTSGPVVVLNVSVPLDVHPTQEISGEVMAIARRTARAPCTT